MSDERLQKLRANQLISAEIASQYQNLQPKHLEKIRKLWQEQEILLLSDESEAQPTMQELVSDLRVIDQTGSCVGHFIKNLRANVSQFDPSEYAEKLVDLLTENDENEMDWEKLADIAVPIINRVPGVTVLLGTFKPSVEEVGMIEKRKKSVTKKKDPISQKQTAEDVKHLTQDHESVDAKVTIVLSALKRCYRRNGNTPVGFYRFVLHPTDFTATVENIFYISFIIRDGLAALDIVDDEFVIAPTKEKTEKSSSSKIEKNQMVFSITMSQWQELVNDYQISEAVIDWTRNNS